MVGPISQNVKDANTNFGNGELKGMEKIVWNSKGHLPFDGKKYSPGYIRFIFLTSFAKVFQEC